MPGAGPPGPAAWAAPVAETPPTGLTSTEVGERRAGGLGAGAPERSSRSVGGILRANVLTRFNAILGALLVVILAVGQPQDALFGVVLIANALIGIGQELRAKLTLDRLAVLSAPQVQVVRDGEAREIAVADLVAGDWVDLRRGDQLVADGVVRASAGLEVDESLLTGESDPVARGPGERLLSGSFVVAGSGGYQATEVGADAYARKLAAQARRFTLVRSELMEGINRILRYITWAMVPVAALLLVSQVHARDSVSEALTGTVAALVGMVPQGLVLLTSVAFGVAAITLARRRVLLQQLPAVEVLARVDVVCFDKTGTLTDGSITFDRVIRLDDAIGVDAALGALAGVGDQNATLAAIGQAFPAPAGWARDSAVPFSSARKWSAASFDGHGTWVLGAPEVVLAAGHREHLARAATLAVAVGVTLLPYPFLPRHLTIVDTLAIGVPSFFLALASNRRRYQPGFAGRVLRFAVPSGCIVAAAAFAAYVQARAAGLPLTGQLTTATVVTLILSMCVLIRQAVPLTWPRTLMIAGLLAAFALLFPVPVVRDFYGLAPPGDNLWATLLIAALGIVALAVSWRAWPPKGGEAGRTPPAGLR